VESPAGTVVWITGPPASGKTTVARLLIGGLKSRGHACLWLDSDDLRAALTPEATYTDADRAAFYRALAQIARLGAEGGATVVISATGSRRAFRDELRAAVSRFVEVWLRCDEAVLRRRDVKGLYRRADAGDIRNLPGAGAAYEPPEHAEIVLDADRASPEELAETILRELGAPTPQS
jgi:adenylylsulfate kinase-like enzyme